MTTAYLAATSVVGVGIVAGLLGMSALLPVAIPIFLLSLPLMALARNSLTRSVAVEMALPVPNAKEWLMSVSSVGCQEPSLAAAIC